MGQRHRGKLTALLLAAVMTLGSCGLREEGTAGEGPDTAAQTSRGEGEVTSGGGASGETVWSGQGGCYKLELPEFPESVVDIAAYGGKFYILSMELADEDTSMSVNCEGKTLCQADDIMQMWVDDTGVWCVLNTTDYAAGGSAKYELVQMGHDGQELLHVDISERVEDSFLRDMCADREGRVFILLEDSVTVLAADGSFLGNIPLGTDGVRLVQGGDGLIYAVGDSVGRSEASALAEGVGRSKGGKKIFRLNLETSGAESLAEYDGYSICNGKEEYLYTIVNDEGLYGVASPGTESVPIAVWQELGLAFHNLWQVQWLPDGKIFLRDSAMTALLVPAKPGEIKLKKEITVASVNPWVGIDGIVNQFNLSGGEYLVRIIDYSQKNSLSTDEAVNALNLDIMSGNEPDLFCFSMLPESYYTAKGLVEDLYTFMDEDAEVRREDYLMLDKLETDGKLYGIPLKYYMESCAGLYTRFGDRYGWTLDEYLEIQDGYSGEIVYNITREGFLNTMASRYAAKAVDWKNQTCDFQSEEFIKILNSVARIRENPEPENPADLNFTPAGKRLSEGSLIVSYLYVDTVGSLAALEAEAGQRLSCVGWPTADGSGGTILRINQMFGICSKGDTEGAWAFLKYAVTEGGKRSDYGIPVSRSLLEERIGQAMSPGHGEEQGPVLGEEDVRRLYDLMDHAVYFGTPSQKVVDIVMEEAAPFLHGDRSAEKTAEIIQSRVRILVAE